MTADAPATTSAGGLPTTSAPRIYPTVHYPDVDQGAAFLAQAFGFAEHVIYRDGDGNPVHTELRCGPSIVFVGKDPMRVGTGSLYVAVDDADAHCERARRAGARITAEPFDTDYGSRDYAAIDPAGIDGSSARTARRSTPHERCAEAELSPRPAAPAVREAVPGGDRRRRQSVVAGDGIEALTMQRVATQLGASPMAIYRHVADKDELLVLLLDRLAARVPRPAMPADPRERVLAACRTSMTASPRTPGRRRARSGRPDRSVDPGALEEIVAGLIACGLDNDQAVDGYRVIWQYTVGTLIVQRGIAEVAALGRPPYVLQVLTSVDPTSSRRSRDSRPTGRPRASVTPTSSAWPLVDGLLARGSHPDRSTAGTAPLSLDRGHGTSIARPPARHAYRSTAGTASPSISERRTSTSCSRA